MFELATRGLIVGTNTYTVIVSCTLQVKSHVSLFVTFIRNNIFITVTIYAPLYNKLLLYNLSVKNRIRIFDTFWTPFEELLVDNMALYTIK